MGIAEITTTSMKAALSSMAAQSLRVSGREYDAFGRRMGMRLLSRFKRQGFGILLNPVSIYRYFEFPFVASCLPARYTRVLDISSPNLFALKLAQERRGLRIDVINPDVKDSKNTQELANIFELDNVSVRNQDALGFLENHSGYDFIWSISVIEHIAGSYDDRDAIRAMYQSLAPGGRLSITVPVARLSHDEYRDGDPYGTQPRDALGRVFFYRHYDKETLRSRLIDSVGVEPIRISYFGEKEAGHFQNYERRWLEHGRRVTSLDALIVARNYKEFATWEEMPGVGVVGLCFEKGSDEIQ